MHSLQEDTCASHGILPMKSAVKEWGAGGKTGAGPGDFPNNYKKSFFAGERERKRRDSLCGSGVTHAAQRC